MTTLAQTTPITSSDRLSMTLFFALAFHAIVILGVSFDLSDDMNNPPLTTMEITLVQNHSEEAPEDADYLAQANQMGGGNIEEKVHDQSPFSNPEPTPNDGFAPAGAEFISPPAPQPKPAQQEILSVLEAEQKTLSEPLTEPLPELPETVTAAQLLERSRQKIANMSAKINRLKKTYHVTPKRTYVRGANAREYRFASYLDAWRAKVERIGNLNYPEAALREKLDGRLLLDVAINPDGSLKDVRVLQSSGHKILDEAARRIVRLAAPFPPLTEDIKQDTDVLHIPRVWYFKSGVGLQTQSQ
ncbi:MAG: energy transducer TonB [Gammaproteobacteria bacterium]|nr:energy transducer TonB [Gammaproteobacteria bacterium]